ARGLLPETVDHGDASFNAGRAALMTAAVCGHPEALYDATRDRLHEAFRAPAMPPTLELVHDLREHARLPAVVSGAGHIVLPLCSTPTSASVTCSAEIIRQIDLIRRSTSSDWGIPPLHADPAVVRTPYPHS